MTTAIQRAAAELRKRRAYVRVAEAALHQAIRAALDAGEPVASVAEQSGYTRQRIHQIRRRL